MGVNTASVTKVLLTNVEAANTGTSLANIANGDVLVLNKQMAVLTGTPKVSDPNCDTIYIALGLPNGKFELSQPIQLSGVINAALQPYEPYVLQKSKFTVPAVTVGKTVQLIVLQEDEHRINAQRQTRRFYDVEVLAADTPSTVATKFADKVNADPASCVTATTNAAELILTAKEVEQTYMDTFARILFDAALNVDGATFASLVAVDAPKRGEGTGILMRELEQSTLRNQRLAHPIIDPKLKGVEGNTYNSLAIMHRNLHNGDFSGQVSSPMTAFLAFKTTYDGVALTHGPSAKQTAVVAVLESLIESAGKNVQ